VGTVVNSEGGQDSFAFATVLPVKKIEVLYTLWTPLFQQPQSSPTLTNPFLSPLCAQKLTALKGIVDSLVAGLNNLLKTAPSDEVQLLRDCLTLDKPASHPATASAAAAVGSNKSPKQPSAQSGLVHAARTGLLLHKRFTNLPLQLVSALHRNLEEDVCWAQQQATDEDESAQENTTSSSSAPNSAHKGSAAAAKQSNFFAEARNVVLFCECDVSKEGKSTYNLSENGSTCYNVLGSCSDIVFACFEDEVYLQHATAAVLWRPPRSLCSTDLVALLVPLSKLKKCANGISELIPE
jgi:hypothetical protein